MDSKVYEMFNFTRSDLDYNRSGMLSPEQQARGATGLRRTKQVVFLIGVVVLLVAAGWIYSFLSDGENIAAIIGGIVFGLPGLWLMYVGVRPARKVTIETVRGRGKIARVENSQTFDGRTTTSTDTELHIGDRIFTLPDEAYSALPTEAEYTLYVWEGVDEILSMEIEEREQEPA
jgi:hypothetical protein